MITLWCEYDIGQEGLVFTSSAGAELWIKQYSSLDEMLEEDQTIDELMDEMFENGLLCFSEVTVINDQGETEE